MFDFSWANILHSNVLNFIIVLAIIVAIVKKLQVGSKIEDMRAEVEKTVVDSDNLKAQAENDLQVAKKDLENVGEELENIMKTAEATVKGIEAKVAEEVKSLIKKAQDNSERIVDLESKKIKHELSAEITENALKIAKDNLCSQLGENKDLHRKFIDESINELDKLEI